MCVLSCQRGYDGLDVNVFCLDTGDVALGKDDHDLTFPLCTPRKCLTWDPAWPQWSYAATSFAAIDWSTYEGYKALGVNYMVSCENTRYRESCNVTCASGYWGKNFLPSSNLNALSDSFKDSLASWEYRANW
jgi:hypothetical protein